MSDHGELKAEIEIKLLKGNSVILDKQSAYLLKAISRTGSLLAASKLLGIPYSKAWRTIANIERRFGHKVIAPMRGGRLGGGTELTESGKYLLNFYSRLESKYGIGREALTDASEIKRPDLVIMGSHDLLLEKIADYIRKKGKKEVEIHWIGSYGGLLSLSLGEADIAGIHIMDPKTSQYNVPIIKEMFPRGVALFRGFDREIGWVFREDFSLESLLKGKARLANRNKGSGTRILIDKILMELVGEKGEDIGDIIKIKGYNKEYYTHTAACKAVAERKADVTISIRPVAELFKLKFKTILWESYDFAIKEEISNKDSIKLFLETLAKRKQKQEIHGYRIPGNIGSRIF